MVEFKHCKTEDLIADAKAHKHLTFLKEIAKPGKSYIEVKRAYYKEFYPDMLPKAAKKKNFWELIDEA